MDHGQFSQRLLPDRRASEPRAGVGPADQLPRRLRRRLGVQGLGHLSGRHGHLSRACSRDLRLGQRRLGLVDRRYGQGAGTVEARAIPALVALGLRR